MARRYTIPIVAVPSPAAIFDAWEINAGAVKDVLIIRIVIGQSSDVGDAQEEIPTASIIRLHATSGSGGSATTPQPVDDGDAAAALTAETMNTTIASTGSPETTHVVPWNIRVGMDHVFPAGSEPKVMAATRTVVRISAPADSITIGGYVEIEEQ